MAQDIKALIRLKKFGVDEERRKLGELLGHEAELTRREQALEAGVKREQELATADPTGICAQSYGNFAESVVRDRARMRDARAKLEAAIARQQDVVAEAYREFKTVEILQQNRDRRAALEYARKDQIIMDEIAANNHRRRAVA
jgi:flagellar export protein FliJ